MQPHSSELRCRQQGLWSRWGLPHLCELGGRGPVSGAGQQRPGRTQAPGARQVQPRWPLTCTCRKRCGSRSKRHEGFRPRDSRQVLGRGRGPLYSTHFLSLGPPHTSTSVGRRGSASRGQQGAEPSRGRGCRGIGQPASAQTLPEKVTVYSQHPRFTARSVDTTSCRRALRPLTK